MKKTMYLKDIKEEMEAYEPVEIDLSLIQSKINRRQNKIINKNN